MGHQKNIYLRSTCSQRTASETPVNLSSKPRQLRRKRRSDVMSPNSRLHVNAKPGAKGHHTFGAQAFRLHYRQSVNLNPKKVSYKSGPDNVKTEIVMYSKHFKINQPEMQAECLQEFLLDQFFTKIPQASRFLSILDPSLLLTIIHDVTILQERARF